MKFDFHAHILPETWPNLKEVKICLIALSNNITLFRILSNRCLLLAAEIWLSRLDLAGS